MKKIEEYKKRIDELIELADQTLLTKQVSDFNVFVNYQRFSTFRSSALSFLKNLYGESHPMYEDFIKRCREAQFHQTEMGRGILLAAKDEITNGWLFTLKGLVASEIFSDFLEMAKYLIDEKYKDPAAVMIGSVLEEHLRQLCLKNGIPTETIKDSKPIAKKAELLNSELAGINIYNKLDQKSVTSWLDLRNKAAHGKYIEYTQQQVELMYSGVLDFISRNSI